ncbi:MULTISPECIES: polymerase [unclassified Mesorhizobium]|uniref:polymerase n=1 Tax=unclassified Mesorhizobium TaxID=325217 RepID=UPI000F7577C4|nr:MULTISPECIES: polymerase [unclassified Mesorhizobium]AZO28480.1 polymerase [Mesorhizobium sp. M1B.F.Ca.ET.045.04.1.1]RWA59238.1 MAG: polymerase [Mesorhizobium sp.]RWA81817.1 MAG: polymerase [Mesorhizobium sp.]RWB18717.1 MAG: polymerase [Mesorhizobium sp.]
MQLGSIIANIFAALLLICALAIGFFIFGKPLWPEDRARMAIVLPIDTATTASVKPTSPRADVPTLCAPKSSPG